jgi:uncharacterized protein YggE
MIPVRHLPIPILALAACGGQPARAQTPAPPDDGLAHPYLYEVSAGQAAAPAVPQEAPPPFIEVSGQGTATVTPDLARATFAVETRADSAAEASARNADAMDAVLRALRAAGIEGLRVETYGYSLQPEYSYPTENNNRTRVIDAYTALNNVRATVPDVTAVGRVIDVAVRAGANRVSSLSFEASDTETARREALTAAVRAARVQAEAIAQALGRALGPAIEVHGGAADNPPRPMMGDVMFRAQAQAAPTPIEAADQTITANVTVRFALGPASGGR